MDTFITSFQGVPARHARLRHALGLALFLALFLVASSSAWAAPASLTLDEALRLAEQASEAAQAARASVAAGEHAAARADQLPDPSLKFGIDNLPVSGPDQFRPNADFMTMRRIGIEQQWVSRDKRRLRAERARRAVAADQAAVLERLADVRVETGKAWFSVLYMQRALGLARSIARAMESDLAAVQAAHRGAKASASDVLQAKAELVLSQDGVEAAEQELASARIGLRRWIRTDTTAVDESVPTLDTPVSSFTLPDLEQYHPAVLGARRARELADADASTAVEESKPDWTFELGFAQRSSQFSNMVSFGVSVPLTINRPQRQQREIAEKAELGTRARLELQDTLVETQATIAAQSTQLESLKRRIARLKAELLPPAQQQVEAALAEYRGGTGTLTAVFRARRTALERTLQVNALELQAALTWAALELRVLPRQAAPAGRAGQ